MAAIDHWNPVALSRDLQKAPLGVQVDGRELVLFRTAAGEPGALDDVCIHRRMRLSCGAVDGDQLVCPYHGWRFQRDGNTESPGTPKMRPRVPKYDVREAHGVVWVKPDQCPAEFPRFDVAGFHPLASLRYEVPVPLELAVDNFSEVEHTPMTHLAFGYDLRRMAETTVEVEAHEDRLHCRTLGPHMPMKRWMRFFMRIGSNMQLRSEWDTFFSPVHLVIDHVITDLDTKRDAMIQYRAWVLFTPITADRTAIFSIVFVHSKYPGPKNGVRLMRPVLRRWAADEIEFDCVKLRQLADKRPDLNGAHLSRFDRLLILNRQYIDRIYRGGEPTPTVVAPGSTCDSCTDGNH